MTSDSEIVSDYIARGLASEAIQTFRSHDALDTLRFENMAQQFKELKDLIATTNEKIDKGFRSYDNKFWTLAVSIIFSLLGGLATICYHLLIR